MLGKQNLSVQWFYFKVVGHESKTDGVSQLKHYICLLGLFHKFTFLNV